PRGQHVEDHDLALERGQAHAASLDRGKIERGRRAGFRGLRRLATGGEDEGDGKGGERAHQHEPLILSREAPGASHVAGRASFTMCGCALPPPCPWSILGPSIAASSPRSTPP